MVSIHPGQPWRCAVGNCRRNRKFVAFTPQSSRFCKAARRTKGLASDREKPLADYQFVRDRIQFGFVQFMHDEELTPDMDCGVYDDLSLCYRTRSVA